MKKLALKPREIKNEIYKKIENYFIFNRKNNVFKSIQLIETDILKIVKEQPLQDDLEFIVLNENNQ